MYIKVLLTFGVANPTAVVEQNADVSIRQLKAESVLVWIVDPLGDENRLEQCRIRIICSWEHDHSKNECEGWLFKELTQLGRLKAEV